MRSYLELIINPLPDLYGSIGTFKGSFAMFHTIFPQSLKLVSICALVYTLAMEQIINKGALIDIAGAKLEYAYAMFETTTPVAFILGAGQEIVPAIAMNLVIDKVAWVLFTGGVVVFAPAVFHLILEFALVGVAVVVGYFETVLG